MTLVCVLDVSCVNLFNEVTVNSCINSFFHDLDNQTTQTKLAVGRKFGAKFNLWS